MQGHMTIYEYLRKKQGVKEAAIITQDIDIGTLCVCVTFGV